MGLVSIRFRDPDTGSTYEFKVPEELLDYGVYFGFEKRKTGHRILVLVKEDKPLIKPPFNYGDTVLVDGVEHVIVGYKFTSFKIGRKRFKGFRFYLMEKSKVR